MKQPAALAAQLPRVADALDGATVFLTGATGYLGMLLLRHLADAGVAGPGPKEVVLLARAGKGFKSAQERFRKETLATGLFTSPELGATPQLRAWIDRHVSVLEGDVAHPRLGLSAEAHADLAARLNVAIHFAALPNFYAPVNEIMQCNVLGATRMADLAAAAPNLRLHLHVSTAFSHGDGGDGAMDEAPFVWGHAPSGATFDPLEEVEWGLAAAKDPFAAAAAVGLGDALPTGPAGDEAKLRKKQLKELGRARARQLGWQDAYTYSKSIAGKQTEMLLCRREERLPLVILRPAIVEGVAQGQTAGWSYGWAESSPFVAGCMAGHIPGFPVGGTIDVVPADAVMQVALAALAKHAAPRGQRTAFTEVYQVCSTDTPAGTIDAAVLFQSMRAFMAKRGWSAMNLEGRPVSPAMDKGTLLPLTEREMLDFLDRRYAAPYVQVGPGSAPGLRRQALEASIKHKIYTYLTQVYARYLVPLRPYVFTSHRARALVAARHPADAGTLPFSWEAFDWPAYVQGHWARGLCGHNAEHFEFTRAGFLTRRQRLALAAASAGWGLRYAAGTPLRAALACARPPAVVDAPAYAYAAKLDAAQRMVVEEEEDGEDEEGSVSLPPSEAAAVVGVY